MGGDVLRGERRAQFTGAQAGASAVVGSLPAAWRLRHSFVTCPRGTAFNGVLFSTFRLELWFAALLSAGALLGHMVR